MSELLAPAGNITAAYAAISQGANAIYIGLNVFSARAYAQNFTLEEVKRLTHYCHLRHVSLYVTINTIIFEDELATVYELVDQLYDIGVDAIIIQDLAVINYMQKFANIMESHASTQMGIDSADGVLFLKKLNVSRVVLAREVPIEKAIEIKKQTKMPIELFIHGALCVSYSGNCLMSGLIGYRSGNRGRCVGSCRKPYTLHNKTTQKTLSTNYLLSMKDLNTTAYLDQLRQIDSLKIEGRMKDPSYVASVTSIYRQILDQSSLLDQKEINERLTKTFQRTFTKGYLFGEDKSNIVNVQKPNNFGFLVGRVSNVNKQKITIALTAPINQFDHIRIDNKHGEINLPLTKMYNADGLLINQANSTFCLTLNEKVTKDDLVYLTKDTKYLKEVEKSYCDIYQRFDIDMDFYVVDNQMTLTISDKNNTASLMSPYIITPAINKPTTIGEVTKQLSKLGDTIYQVKNINVSIGNNHFIPLKELNELRRLAIELFDETKVKLNRPTPLKIVNQSAKVFVKHHPVICASVKTKKQYQACLEMGLKEENIYYQNIVRRNNTTTKILADTVLIGGFGSILPYQGKTIIADYSFNVVNSETIRLLHEAGVNRVTLSYELNKKQIKSLLNSYIDNSGGIPNVELIVYGRQPLMVTNYCPLRYNKCCGDCRKNAFTISDDHNTIFPLFFDYHDKTDDCQTIIYNAKILNLLDEIPSIENVNYFRLAFTDETPESVSEIIAIAQRKNDGQDSAKVFNEKTDTRGHYNKEVL